MALAALTLPQPPPSPAGLTAGPSLEVPIRRCRRCTRVIIACTAVLLGALAPGTAAAQRDAPQWVVRRDSSARTLRAVFMFDGFGVDAGYYYAFKNSITGPFQTMRGPAPGTAITSSMTESSFLVGVTYNPPRR